MISTLGPLQALEIALTIEIDAPRDRVWVAIVNETSNWWPEGFYSIPQPHRFVIEPIVGGRAYEANGEEEGVLWYHVISIRVAESLLMAGHIDKQFGGPATTILRLTLEELDGGRVALHVRDNILGCVSEENARTIETGWQELFEKGLKRYLEK